MSFLKIPLVIKKGRKGGRESGKKYLENKPTYKHTKSILS